MLDFIEWTREAQKTMGRISPREGALMGVILGNCGRYWQSYSLGNNSDVASGYHASIAN